MDDDLIPQDLEIGTQVGASPPPAPESVGAEYDKSLNRAGGIQKVKWDHIAVIDFMLQNPFAKQNDIALQFAVTPAWLSRIINSDAFRNKFAERRKEHLGEEAIVAMQEVDERLNALANDSLEKLHEKIHNSAPNMDMLLRTAELALKAKGYGAKGPSVQINQNNSFVVALPAKEQDADSWTEKYAPRKPQVFEGEKA